jgi:hypothetical protein
LAGYKATIVEIACSRKCLLAFESIAQRYVEDVTRAVLLRPGRCSTAIKPIVERYF